MYAECAGGIRENKKRTDEWESAHEQNWNIFTLPYKCALFLNIASLLLHLTRDAANAENIQKTLIKDVGVSCMENS